MKEDVVTRASVQRMIQWRCAVTVAVQELRLQNCQVTERAKLQPTVWAKIKIKFVNSHLQEQYKNTYFYSTKLAAGVLFNDTA